MRQNERIFVCLFSLIGKMKANKIGESFFNLSNSRFRNLKSAVLEIEFEECSLKIEFQERSLKIESEEWSLKIEFEEKRAFFGLVEPLKSEIFILK